MGGNEILEYSDLYSAINSLISPHDQNEHILHDHVKSYVQLKIPKLDRYSLNSLLWKGSL